MGKHFSKGKLCQMELTAGPKSRETAGHRGNQVMYTPAPPPSPGRIRRQRTKAESPWLAGQGQVPAHLHIPMLHPLAPGPQGQTP